MYQLIIFLRVKPLEREKRDWKIFWSGEMEWEGEMEGGGSIQRIILYYRYTLYQMVFPFTPSGWGGPSLPGVGGIFTCYLSVIILYWFWGFVIIWWPFFLLYHCIARILCLEMYFCSNFIWINKSIGWLGLINEQRLNILIIELDSNHSDFL